MFGLSGSSMSCGNGGTGRGVSPFVMERGGAERTHGYQGIPSQQRPIVFQRR